MIKLCILPLFLLYCLGQAAALGRGELVSVQFLGAETRAAIADEFDQPLVSYDVQYYRAVYTTLNTAGQIDTVSGLIAIPIDPTRTFPRLLYQHGTAASKTDVPSFNATSSSGEGRWALLFAGVGFITLMPDYLGLGVAKGFHPYVHAASESWVAADMLRAFPAFAQQYGVHANEQLFVTGYSQGGHASMAFHRDAESIWKAEFPVTAAAHLSGPYSLGEVMRDMALSDGVYLYPAYIPNLLIGYQGVYGNIYNSLEEVFRSQYVGDIAEFRDGKINLLSLQIRLVAKLTLYELACRPRRLFRPEFLQAITTDPNHPLNVALRENNTYHWASQAPTRLYYCSGDDQVPHQNTLLARDTMLARGAKNLAAADVKPGANHSNCVEPAIDSAISFFLTYRTIGLVSAVSEAPLLPLVLQPNPTSGTLWLRQLSDAGLLEVFDLSGRVRSAAQVDAPGDFALDLSSLERGIYLVRFTSGNRIWQNKVVISR